MKTSFYSEDELATLGLKSYGKNVLISRHACLYSPETISIGNNVRIDDFCILSGNITLGSNIHISSYCALYGAKGIIFEDNTGCSARTTIYSAIDDFSGEYLIGPMQPECFTNVTGGVVRIKEYVQIGAHCLIFPNLTIGEGAVLGAFSFTKKDLPSWGIYAGIPCKKIKNRSKELKKIIIKKI